MVAAGVSGVIAVVGSFPLGVTITDTANSTTLALILSPGQIRFELRCTGRRFSSFKLRRGALLERQTMRKQTVSHSITLLGMALPLEQRPTA
jgi:hypothetical protein